MGHIYINTGKYADAVGCCEVALELSKQRPLQSAAVEATIWVTKGLGHEMMGQLTTALKCFNKALELNPQNAKARSEIQVTHRLMAEIGRQL
jgi:tetratricopeptide (TPR) repeat protein